jgi:cyclic-di-AMP phosphodiesterase PgpH
VNQNSSPKQTTLTVKGIIARVILGLATWLVIIAVVILNVIPEKHVVKSGDIAAEDIKATHDIVDSITTAKKRKEAVDSVPDKYKQDDAVTADVISALEECYVAIDKIRVDGADEISKLNNNVSSAAYKDTKGDIQFTAYFLQQCHEELTGSFTDEDVRFIILVDKKELSLLKDKVITLMTQALKNGIKAQYLTEQISSVNQELISPLNRFDDGAQRLGMNLVSTYLKANFIADEEATAEAKKKASDEVQPEIYKRDQIIVQHGLPVTDAEIQVLSDLGLLDENDPHMLMYLGVGVMSALLLLVIWLYVLNFETSIFNSFRKLLLLNVIFVLTVGAMWLGRSVHYYFLLSTTGVLLISVLVNQRLSLMVNAVLALFAGIMAGSDGTGAFSSAALPAAMAAVAGGAVALYIIRGTPHRSGLMLAGIASGLMSAAIFVAVDLITAMDWQVTLQDLGAGLGGGLASSMICLGTLPLWEYLFKVVTPMKLLELANPNHPLLKRLLIEASGTYHHSIIMGNLAENAAEAIGANALLTRTGAYYHDVGKLMRPYFFTENQLGNENPHESIAPELSKRILTAHTKDGMELAAKYGLPQPIQEIILEHHGTTPVMYFYHKAVKLAKEDETISMDDYRYAGPKPQTRESAIIMLADSIEAGARTLEDHSQEKLDEFVQNIVNIKLEDGQFDDCELTLRDISIISAEFRKVLGGIFHERIVYPTVETVKRGKSIK